MDFRSSDMLYGVKDRPAGPMITVLYSCRDCGLTNTPVTVPARLQETDDILIWMDQTMFYTGRDHKEKRPGCLATVLHELMIPVNAADDSTWIGAPIQNHQPGPTVQ